MSRRLETILSRKVDVFINSLRHPLSKAEYKEAGDSVMSVIEQVRVVKGLDLLFACFYRVFVRWVDWPMADALLAKYAVRSREIAIESVVARKQVLLDEWRLLSAKHESLIATSTIADKLSAAVVQVEEGFRSHTQSMASLNEDLTKLQRELDFAREHNGLDCGATHLAILAPPRHPDVADSVINERTKWFLGHYDHYPDEATTIHDNTDDGRQGGPDNEPHDKGGRNVSVANKHDSNRMNDDFAKDPMDAGTCKPLTVDDDPLIVKWTGLCDYCNSSNIECIQKNHNAVQCNDCIRQKQPCTHNGMNAYGEVTNNGRVVAQWNGTGFSFPDSTQEDRRLAEAKVQHILTSLRPPRRYIKSALARKLNDFSPSTASLTDFRHGPDALQAEATMEHGKSVGKSSTQGVDDNKPTGKLKKVRRTARMTVSAPIAKSGGGDDRRKRQTGVNDTATSRTTCQMPVSLAPSARKCPSEGDPSGDAVSHRKKRATVRTTSAAGDRGTTPIVLDSDNDVPVGKPSGEKRRAKKGERWSPRASSPAKSSTGATTSTSSASTASKVATRPTRIMSHADRHFYQTVLRSDPYAPRRKHTSGKKSAKKRSGVVEKISATSATDATDATSATGAAYPPSSDTLYPGKATVGQSLDEIFRDRYTISQWQDEDMEDATTVAEPRNWYNLVGGTATAVHLSAALTPDAPLSTPATNMLHPSTTPVVMTATPTPDVSPAIPLSHGATADVGPIDGHTSPDSAIAAAIGIDNSSSMLGSVIHAADSASVTVASPAPTSTTPTTASASMNDSSTLPTSSTESAEQTSTTSARAVGPAAQHSEFTLTVLAEYGAILLQSVPTRPGVPELRRNSARTSVRPVTPRPLQPVLPSTSLGPSSSPQSLPIILTHTPVGVPLRSSTSFRADVRMRVTTRHHTSLPVGCSTPRSLTGSPTSGLRPLTPIYD
ncbi:hypothetical protein C8Q78DRAFT_1079659 [Trametes maxima]|nr:hypothetical protein C8Q78DRAFT_1079659 [Trametes maxima]